MCNLLHTVCTHTQFDKKMVYHFGDRSVEQLGARERPIVFPPFPKWDEPGLSWVRDGIASVRAAVVVRRRTRPRKSRASS